MSLVVEGAMLDGDRVGLRTADGTIAELGPDVEPHDGGEVLAQAVERTRRLGLA